MFNKKNRITKKKEIEGVFKKGWSFYNEILGFKVLKNNLEYNRFCIIVSSKVSKKAVVRNKIKRQIRAILIEEKLKLKPGFDVLFIVNKNINSKNFLEIKDFIKMGLQKLKIYG